MWQHAVSKQLSFIQATFLNWASSSITYLLWKNNDGWEISEYYSQGKENFNTWNWNRHCHHITHLYVFGSDKSTNKGHNGGWVNICLECMRSIPSEVSEMNASAVLIGVRTHVNSHRLGAHHIQLRPKLADFAVEINFVLRSTLAMTKFSTNISIYQTTPSCRWKTQWKELYQGIKNFDAVWLQWLDC